MPELAPRELHQRLRAKFGEAGGPIADLPETGEATAVVVAPASIVDVCRWLRDEPGLDFDCLTNLSGVDYPKREVIQLVYHLYSYAHLRLVVLKVDLPRDDPQAPSVESVWPTANWMERE